MTRELRRLLTFGGPSIWLMVAAPALFQANGARFAWWAAAYCTFAVAFLLALRRQRPWWLILQAAAAICTVLAMCDGFEGALLVLIALQLGGSTDRRAGLAAIALQSAGLGVAVGIHWNAQAALLLLPPYLGFQLLAFFAAEGLVRLAAADELRMENGRLEERLRISRELHDRLGHHLTALKLNLEVAERSPEALSAARKVARSLLAEVREAVAELREPERIDVCGALRTLAVELPAPRVHLNAPESLPLRDAGALTVLRCAQEMVTNAARHAQAENLWLELTQQGGTLMLSARDDGRGAADPQPGNGLRGMRERLESAGGTLLVRTAPGEGFSLRATLPLPDGK
jgi:signal transduction histidine kinase